MVGSSNAAIAPSASVFPALNDPHKKLTVSVVLREKTGRGSTCPNPAPSVLRYVRKQGARLQVRVEQLLPVELDNSAENGGRRVSPQKQWVVKTL